MQSIFPRPGFPLNCISKCHKCESKRQRAKYEAHFKDVLTFLRTSHRCHNQKKWLKSPGKTKSPCWRFANPFVQT